MNPESSPPAGRDGHVAERPLPSARRSARRSPSSWPLSWAKAVVLVTAAGLPLVAWPGLERPFSTPKLWLLIVSLIVVSPVAFVAHMRAGGGDASQRAAGGSARMVRLLAIGWLASWVWSALLGDVVSLDALLLALATSLFAITLIAIAPDPGQLTSALVIGATGVAAVAMLQWTGVDPFAIAGWVAPIAGASPRLRVYGTLGNPNFVAAVLAAAVPLTVGLIVSRGATGAPRANGVEFPTQADSPPYTARLDRGVGLGHLLPSLVRGRVLAAVALVLQLAALAATGSRAGALGLIAAALTWLVFGLRSRGNGGSRGNDAPTGEVRHRHATGVALVAGLAGCLLAIAFIGSSTARPLRDTLAGRFYIWQVAWPHAFDAPWAGQGPGAFELRYPEWEVRHDHRTFPGPQQHAHNDYLEALIDRGLAGPVTIFVVLATCFREGWRRSARKRAATRLAPVLTGAVAALAALGAIACVDFPLARPTETLFFWSAVALLGLAESEEGSS